MKKRILLSLSLLVSVWCVAQNQTESIRLFGSIGKTEISNANADVKTALYDWKASKATKATEYIERLDSIVGITEEGAHKSKEE